MANGKLQSMELTATLKLKLIAEISIGVRLKNEKNWVSKMNSLCLNTRLMGKFPHFRERYNNANNKGQKYLPLINVKIPSYFAEKPYPTSTFFAASDSKYFKKSRESALS